MDSCKLIGYGGATVGIIFLLSSAILRVYISQELGLSANLLTQNFIMILFAVGIIAEIIGIFGFWISYFNDAKTTKIQKQKSQTALGRTFGNRMIVS
jgi:hypothetical protein